MTDDPAQGRVSIAPLAETDREDWRRLWTLYLAFYKKQVTDEVYATTWARLLSGEIGEFRGLIARRASADGSPGAAVGLAHFLIHRHCHRVENVCYLQDLFVDDTRRGAGAGRALIEAVYAAADAEGCGDVYWLTQTSNRRARQLYDRVAVETDFIKYSRGP